ncbi:MAG: fibronectin type III domain-containing protein [Gammaproteobacteria bacterium]|nr:fibronectin type III domain-containing protein [Gammaproteobacteria bacterium]
MFKSENIQAIVGGINWDKKVLKLALLALAIAALGLGISQSPAEAAAPAAPGAVTDLKLHAARYVLTAKWTAPDPAPTGKYVAQLFEGNSSTAQATVEVTKTKATFPQLKEGTTYKVSVKAQNTNTEGSTASTAVSATATTLAPPSAPGAVTNLALGNITSKTMSATWAAPNPAPTGRYIVKLFRGNSATGKPVVEDPHLSKKKSKLNFINLDAGTAYTVSVTAQNDNGIGGPVAGTAVTKTATTLAAVAAPGPVTNLTAETVTGSKIAVTWTAPDPAPTGSYLIELIEGGEIAHTKTRNKGATKAIFNYLKKGTSYTVKVTARNKVTEFDFITAADVEVTTTTTDLPAKPGTVTLAASATSNSIAFTWTPIAELTGGYVAELFEGAGTTTVQTKNRGKKSGMVLFRDLTPGTSYTVKVKAYNKNSVGMTDGDQVSKTESTKATGNGLPGKPTNVADDVTRSTTDDAKYSVTVTWDAPASNGGKAITQYFVILYKLGKWDRTNSEYNHYPKSEQKIERVVVQASAARSYTYATAEVDVSYLVQIRAKNSVGAGLRAIHEFSLAPKLN